MINQRKGPTRVALIESSKAPSMPLFGKTNDGETHYEI